MPRLGDIGGLACVAAARTTSLIAVGEMATRALWARLAASRM
jgi:hypothetical protein